MLSFEHNEPFDRRSWPEENNSKVSMVGSALLKQYRIQQIPIVQPSRKSSKWLERPGGKRELLTPLQQR